MKVLNVNMILDVAQGGGTAERTFQMSKFLAKAGVECTILTTDVGLSAERVKDLDGVEVVALPCIFKRFYITKFSLQKLSDIVAKADIIHIMSHWTFINAIIYLLAKRLNKPYVVCPAGALAIFGRSQFIKRVYNCLIGKRIIQEAYGWIAVTADEIAQFQAYGVKRGGITVIPNGINPEEYLFKNDKNFREKHNLGEPPFILFVGRLNYIKGPDLLLEAFCHLQDKLLQYHLVFAGPDEGMLEKLKDMADHYGVADRVHFIGYLGGEDKSHAYHAAEIMAIPSRQEAMSIVALEAGITETPVLMTDQCGFGEIAHINGGRIVSASVEGLQQGMMDLLADPAPLKLMGRNLAAFVREHYTWDSVINKYIPLYTEKIQQWANNKNSN